MHLPAFSIIRESVECSVVEHFIVVLSIYIRYFSSNQNAQQKPLKGGVRTLCLFSEIIGLHCSTSLTLLRLRKSE